MLGADPILWLQSSASPSLTYVMDAISWFGYTRAAIALVTLTAFVHRLRPALAILILIGLNAVATDVVKSVVESPRPFVADPRVAALGSFVPADAGHDDSGFGFPSGHVVTTTTMLLGLWWLHRWRGAWVGLVLWLPLMAISRLYLGRHFVGDVVGGFLLALVTTAVAIVALRLRDLADTPSQTAARRAASLSVVVAVSIVVLAWWAGHAHLADAGRLLGFACAALIVIRIDLPDAPRSWWRRGSLVLLAAGAFALAWVGVAIGLGHAGVMESSGGRVVAAAVPAIAMLVVPGLAMRNAAVAPAR